MELKKTIKKGLRKIKRTILEKIYVHRRTLTLKKICRICKIEIPKELSKYKNKQIKNITLSANDLKPGCILFCIERHLLKPRHVESIKKNCFCVVTPKPIDGCKNIVVEDIKSASLEIFRYIRNLCNTKVIAVTGSVGKTSTKEMIEAVLKEKYGDRMTVSIGNSNSRFKVAYNITRLNYNDKIYLQEVGAGSGAYDLVKFSAVMLNSDIAVYTNIKDSHIEWYGSRENIAKEKFTLSDYGNKDGLALINYDDEILRNHEFEQKRISYALTNPKADYYAKDIKITSEGTKFKIVDSLENKEIPVELKVIGEHHVLNALAAYAIGKYLGIKQKTIIKGIKKYRTSGNRQNLIDVGKYKVLADCYNSSYDAMKSILQTVNIIETKNNGKKIAVIGDIFELGKVSEEIHRKVGTLLAQANLDKVIFQGNEVKYSYEEYKKIKNNAIYCKTRSEMFDVVNKTINEDDLILFKASHGMHFSSAIDTLFGTDIGETSALGHKEYLIKKDNNFLYYVFQNHVTVKEYFGKEKKVIIPNEFSDLPLEKLGKVIFKGNKNIEEITLPENMVRLRGYCFKDSSLKKITFNKNLKQIGPGTFHLCSKLEKIILPDGLLVIEYKAFANCKNLKEIYIPKSTKKISAKAFLDSNNVTINCEKGSFAEQYAKNQGINYKIIEIKGDNSDNNKKAKNKNNKK